MHESVLSENLVNTISQKPVKGISLIFGHKCIWVDVLIRCWGQIVKDQGPSRQ